MSAAALISVLARSFLAGDAAVDIVCARAARTLGRRWDWMRPLAERYVQSFSGGTRPRHRDVVPFLLHDNGFRLARAKHSHRIAIAEWMSEPQRMQPVAAAKRWPLPAIVTVDGLADWLSLYAGELDWFADLAGLCNRLREPKLHHYRYRIVPKRSGGFRLIESPKPYLKELQRRILAGILDRIPAHTAAHGFVKGRSIVTFASAHVGKDAVLRLDLQDFFPAFPAARVQALFRTLGYPEQVASCLGGICTNAVPADVWRNYAGEVSRSHVNEARIMYGRHHLPQGAPTSPALANAMAYRLDCRLTGLAKAAGAVYTRYADDLAFSGEQQFTRSVARFSAHAASIALEEGFSVNHHKTRIMRQGMRQQLAGIVVNRKVGLRRADLEVLEATLVNCVRYGPASQNRERLADFRSTLQGRISFIAMIDSQKGQRLKAIFDDIDWGR